MVSESSHVMNDIYTNYSAKRKQIGAMQLSMRVSESVILRREKYESVTH